MVLISWAHHHYFGSITINIYNKMEFPTFHSLSVAASFISVLLYVYLFISTALFNQSGSAYISIVYIFGFLASFYGTMIVKLEIKLGLIFYSVFTLLCFTCELINAILTTGRQSSSKLGSCDFTPCELKRDIDECTLISIGIYFTVKV
jgi:hypothetical protein